MFPVWLRIPFIIVGILPKESTLLKLIPIPFWLCYWSFAIKTILEYTAISYVGVTDIIKYTDVLTSLGSIISMWVSMQSFYKRDRKLALILEKIGPIDTKFDRIPAIVLLTSSFVNSTLIFSSFPYNLQYYFIFSIPHVLANMDTIIFNIVLKNFEKRFHEINHRLQRMTLKGLDIEKMQKLSHYHFNLVHGVWQVGRIFEATILHNILTCVLTIIAEVYWIVNVYTALSSYVVYSFLDIWVIFSNIGWIFFLIRNWSTLQTEANKSYIYVHHIWNGCPLSKMNSNQNTSLRHLQLISLRFLNTRLELSILGLFTLDWTFLYTTGAAIVTNVLILIQFSV